MAFITLNFSESPIAINKVSKMQDVLYQNDTIKKCTTEKIVIIVMNNTPTAHAHAHIHSVPVHYTLIKRVAIKSKITSNLDKTEKRTVEVLRPHGVIDDNDTSITLPTGHHHDIPHSNVK